MVELKNQTTSSDSRRSLPQVRGFAVDLGLGLAQDFEDCLDRLRFLIFQ